jgi:hypothetical protein
MNSATDRSTFKTHDFVIGLALFLLACLPRAYDLQRFVTADEAKWVYRSAQFLAAFLSGDFGGTSVNLTPAVTTTWLGSLGLVTYYWLNQAAIELPFIEWLRSLPEFRTELELLAATRWPMVVMTSLAVVLIYWLARRLFNRWIAVIAAAFIALDPHTVALSRILGHDAPTAMFTTISLLLLLLALNRAEEQRSRGEEGQKKNTLCPFAPLLLTGFSGLAAGLAFLSKAPALFLVPFAGLLFAGKLWGHSAALYFWFKRFLLWALAAYLTFIIAWPAAWVAPVEQPLAVVENAFLSATDQEEADEEGYWLVPDLGPFYYPVNGAFKLSPLVMVGAGIALIIISSWRLNPRHHLTTKPLVDPTTIIWLLLFILLFTTFMTLGEKRSSRYILPTFPALAIIAAAGWLWLSQVAGGRSQVASQRDHASRITGYPSSTILAALLILSATAILFLYAPYYFTYFNPLAGGPYTAPNLVKIGWGEGLDRVGRFLQREEVTRDSRVGTAYASTVAPFFEGDLSSVTGSNLDYLVLYTKQVQAGQPSPTTIRYFEQMEPVFSVALNGIHYADVYPGPAVQPALTLTPGLDHAILPKPIGFRPLTPYGHLGETLGVDVLWLADEPLPMDPSVVTLEPISVFDFLDEHNHPDGTPVESRPRTVLAQGEGHMTRPADNLTVSRHELFLPADLGRGVYALLVDSRPLGEVELRHFRLPAELEPVDGPIFGNQIALTGYQFTPTADYVGLTIGWQAQKSRLPAYTVFVQLLDAETNQRVAGVDRQPLAGEWPTSRWVRGEVVVDEYLVAIPPDLPPGPYHIIAGLYQPENGQRLTLPDGRDHWLLPWTYIRE